MEAYRNSFEGMTAVPLRISQAHEKLQANLKMKYLQGWGFSSRVRKLNEHVMRPQVQSLAPIMHNTHTHTHPFHALICEMAGQHSTELSAKAEIQILPKEGVSERQATQVDMKWEISYRNKFLQTSEK